MTTFVPKTLNAIRRISTKRVVHRCRFFYRLTLVFSLRPNRIPGAGEYDRNPVQHAGNLGLCRPGIGQVVDKEAPAGRILPVAHVANRDTGIILPAPCDIGHQGFYTACGDGCSVS